MAKLYYTPSSCGAANFIAAYVAGLNIECEVVDIGTHKTASGADFYAINPKGNVPCIALEHGVVLNENAATLQWIVDHATGHVKVGPANGTVERYQLQVLLSYISGELHSSVGPLFNPNISAEVKTFVMGRVTSKLDYIEQNLVKNKTFLLGDSFTVADSYLYIVISWFGYLKVDISHYANITAYYEHIKALPHVQEAHAKMATAPSHTV